MANKRDLKKRIKYICGDLAGECIMARTFIPGIDAEQMNEVVYDIAALQTMALKRVTFGFDKTKKEFADAKAYNKAKSQYFAEAFGQLVNDFNKGVDDVVAAMNKALPAAQKEANKQAINS